MKTFASKIILALYLGFVIFSFTSAFAVDYTLLAPIDTMVTVTMSDASGQATGLGNYLGMIWRVSLGLAGVLAVLMIVWGGFDYVYSDAIGKKVEGKEKIQNALLGLVLALASWLILYTINPSLVNWNLNFGEKLKATEQFGGKNELVSAITNEIREARMNYYQSSGKAKKAWEDVDDMYMQMDREGIDVDRILTTPDELLEDGELELKQEFMGKYNKAQFLQTSAEAERLADVALKVKTYYGVTKVVSDANSNLKKIEGYIFRRDMIKDLEEASFKLRNGANDIGRESNEYIQKLQIQIDNLKKVGTPEAMGKAAAFEAEIPKIREEATRVRDQLVEIGNKIRFDQNYKPTEIKL